MTSRSPTVASSPVEVAALRHIAGGTGHPMSLDALSPGEVNSLRRVRSGLAKFLPSAHRMRLISLGLITVTGGGRLVLTQGGKEQLAEREVPAHCDRTRPLP
jgi:hypothetical protein